MKKTLRRNERSKRLLLTTMIAFVLSFSVVRITRALLSDTEYSMGNNIKAATINLQVGDTDPSTLDLNFGSIEPGQVYKTTTNIISNGGMTGNFWMEANISNSLEEENPESETNTAEPGDLENCAELRIVFDEGTPQELIVLEHTPVSMVTMDLDPLAGSTLDQRLELGTEMTTQIRTNFCNNDAMGDSFDLNLVFHLDQV